MLEITVDELREAFYAQRSSNVGHDSDCYDCLDDDYDDDDADCFCG